MRLAIDTNILVYAEGLDGASKQGRATYLLSRVREHEPVLSIQVPGELFNVLVKKGYSREEARNMATVWQDLCEIVETTSALMRRALDLAVSHRMRVWDALILSAAAEAGCSVLLSEDFQEGFTWNGVTVCNPFLPEPHPLIAELVRE